MIPFSQVVTEGNYRGIEYSKAVAVTSAQSGKTDTFLDIIGHRLDQRPAPILYVGPSADFNRDQFEPRLMSLLEEAACLTRKLIRGRRMKKTLKLVAGVRVRLAHAGSSTSLKSDPAALALIDEYDEMMANVRGQGDVLGLVEARGDTYADFMTAVTSTTSTGHCETEIDPLSGLEFWKPGDPSEIESRIWRLFQEGTRYHFAWKCPHCGEWFIPRRKLLKYPSHSTPVQARRDAYVECPNNGCVIKDEDKSGMNAGGLMVAPGQEVIDDQVVGAPPESSTCSFWTSGLCSPFVSFGKRAQALLTAELSGDPDRIQTAINAGLGELHMPAAGGDLPEWTEIMDRKIGYKTGEVPLEGIRVVAGVDVQKNSLYFVIRAFGGRGTSWLVDYGQIHGPTSEDEVWEDLTDLLLTPIDGLQIEKALIDSGFRPDKPDSGDIHKVYDYCRQMGFLALPSKGLKTANQPYRISQIEVTARGKKTPVSIRLALLNTDFFKSLVHSRLRTPVGSPGALNVPDDITEDYARQLVSEVRVVTLSKGAAWVRRSKDNHFLDCEALAAAAAYALGVQRLPAGIKRNSDAPVPEPAPEAETEQTEAQDEAGDEVEQPVKKKHKQPLSSGLRDKFRGMSNRVNR